MSIRIARVHVEPDAPDQTTGQTLAQTSQGTDITFGIHHDAAGRHQHLYSADRLKETFE